MKKVQPFLILFLALGFQVTLFYENSYCQAPDSLWQYHYGGADNEIGFDIMEGDDGGYYVIGYTKSYGNGGYDAYVLKLDKTGNVTWERTFGGPLSESLLSLCPATGGGFAMTGTYSSESSGGDVWILWINEDGDSLGSRTYGGMLGDGGLWISPTTDGGYIVSATLGTGFPLGDEIYLLKLDALGDTAWTRIFSGPNQDYGEQVIQTNDGGYIIAGRTYASYTPESADAWAIRTDGNGDTLWTKKYGGTDEDIFNCVAETDDGFIFAGLTSSFGPGYYAVYAVRTNEDGDTIWTRTYGGGEADLCERIIRTPEGNFVLSGYSTSFSESNDVYILEIDISGNLIWESSYGMSDGYETVYGSCATSEGGFLITGKTNYYYALKDELFVLKLGSGTGFPDNTQGIPSFKIAPNPFTSSTTIYLDCTNNEPVTIQVFDLFGHLLADLLKNKPVTGHMEIVWDSDGLPQGVYCCKVEIGKDQYISKLIKSE